MGYKYWDYYLVLENDLIDTSRYVEFNKTNMNTYSIEFARIILTACAEIDMVFKEVCRQLTNTVCRNISNYREIILTHRPGFNFRERKISYTQEVVKPFEIWSTQHGNNPEWWRSYNSIKHERSGNFDRASLKNALASLAGLQIVLFELYKFTEGGDELLFEYRQIPKLILPEGRGTRMDGTGIYIRYPNDLN
ncbi:hypothetical protein SAMN06298221_1138 [Sphaerochaeta associata]|uniref:ApeA N-terminal domain-containing protein n=1 Tax=Sphaerochaeta associata TaxID=1129264 RepID=A0ABY4DB11_9SPIR|nr:hypothetical protein [Sphaerochaeta associata]UOM51466.1 hypothetical protein MUG09_01595 [Sphaerochaeta associata]SMP61539.1 hypothetical protein SAMN06298221_1138 [Sphaerochaeta associata]